MEHIDERLYKPLYKRPVSVLVLVYSRCGQVLLLQRTDDPCFWQSVTGSLEPNELPGQAAIRELYEELGISAEDGAVVDGGYWQTFSIRPQWRYRYPPGTTINREYAYYFVCPAPCSVMLSREHISYQWLPATEAQNMAWSSTNQAAIAYHLLGAELPASSANTRQT